MKKTKKNEFEAYLKAEIAEGKLITRETKRLGKIAKKRPDIEDSNELLILAHLCDVRLETLEHVLKQYRKWSKNGGKK